MSHTARKGIVLLPAAALALAVSCGGGANSGSAIEVAVREFEVEPGQSSAAAGRVTFQVTNAGKELHEFAVVKTDLALDALPTLADGSFDEHGEGVEVLAEIPAFEPGGTYELKLDLAAGHYVLLCNRVE